MTTRQAPGTPRAVIAGFDRSADLQAAVHDLTGFGFRRDDLSLLTRVGTVDSKLRRSYRKLGLLSHVAPLPRAAYVSADVMRRADGGAIGVLVHTGVGTGREAVVASGFLASAILGAAAKAPFAGRSASTLARAFGDDDSRTFQEWIDHGDLLLWVRGWHAADTDRAIAILRSHRAMHLRVLPEED